MIIIMTYRENWLRIEERKPQSHGGLSHMKYKNRDGGTDGNNSLQDKFSQLYISMYSELEMRANEKYVVNLKRGIIARNPSLRQKLVKLNKRLEENWGQLMV
jgi:hypothetical protein